MRARTAAALAAAAAAAAAAALAAAPGWGPGAPDAPGGGAGPPAGDPRLGLVVNLPGRSATLAELDAAYARAAAAGAGRTNAYVFWDAVEPEPGRYDWGPHDAQMALAERHGLAVTLYLSVVNGRTLGPFPAWMGEPEAGQVPAGRLAAVLGEALSRYGHVDSVVFASGTAEHFRHAEGGIPAFEELFADVRARLAKSHPGVAVGNSFELDGVLAKGLGAQARRLALGDFAAFTYRPTDVLNEVARTPAEAAADLARIADIAPGRAALLEVGWTTSAAVGGSEADQLEFARHVRQLAASGELEFATWYRLYDRPEGSCDPDASRLPGPSFLGADSGPAVARLGSYLCGAGLLHEDGREKPAWAEFSNTAAPAG